MKRLRRVGRARTTRRSLAAAIALLVAASFVSLSVLRRPHHNATVATIPERPPIAAPITAPVAPTSTAIKRRADPAVPPIPTTHRSSAPATSTTDQAPPALFVAVGGSDTNAGTREAPFRTINHAARKLGPGYSLFVGPGIYEEELRDVIPGGLPGAPVALRALDASNRPVLRPPPGAQRVIHIGGNTGAHQHDILIDGFVLDGANVAYDVLKITDGATHITLRNSEVEHAHTMGVLISDNRSRFNVLDGLDIHDNGRAEPGDHLAPRYFHGVYVSTSDNVIENSRIHHNAGLGVNVYDGETSAANDNTVRNNFVYNNAAAGDLGAGIGLYTGHRNLAYNNVVWGNNGGIVTDYAVTGTKILNNTVYDNQGSPGILVGGGAASAVVQNNIVSHQRTYGLKIRGPAVVRNNLLFANASDDESSPGADNLVGQDPRFVNAAGVDFDLQLTSPAIGRGVSIPEVAFDIAGRRRPLGKPYDVGAYQAPTG